MVVTGGAFRFLVEMLKHIGDDLADAFRVEQRPLGVDGRHLLVGDAAHLHGADVVDAERQHVLVGDGVHDRVGVESLPEGLFGSFQPGVSTTGRIDREDRCARETEQVVPLERLGDRGVHVPELGAVAFVEDDDDVLAIDVVAGVGLDEGREFLDRRDDDLGVPAFQLAFEHRGGRIGIGRTLLETVVFTHGLVVQVLAVHHEKHLVNAVHLGGELGCLETGQGLARAGGVPDIATGFDSAELLVIGGDLDALQHLLGGDDLVRAHHQQHLVDGEDAVPGENVEQRVPGEEGFGKRDQVADRLVLRVRPPRGELERIGGFAPAAGLLPLLQVLAPGGVGVVLGERAIGDDEQLNVLKQTAARPETVPLVPVDLVERLTDVHAPAFELDVHQRQPVDEDRHVVPVGIPGAALTLADLVLVDDLEPVVVDAPLVDQQHILGGAVVPAKQLHVVFVDANHLFGNAVVLPGNAGGEEPIPFGIRELKSVQQFQLGS